MMRIAKIMGTVGAVLALSACASTTTPEIEANRVQAVETEKPLIAAPLLTENPVKEEKPKTQKEIMAAIRQALKISTSNQGDCSYEEGARAICPWFNGHIYTMYLKSGEISTIYLSPDEEMVDHFFSKDAFFTPKAKWAGSVQGMRDVIVVQAWMPHAKTKVTILTNRREYQIRLITNVADYNPSMRFVYPEQMIAGLEAPPVREVPLDPVTEIPLSRLNTRYSANGKIGELKGEQIQVMDDTKRTYVVFPEGVTIRPPYFAITDGEGNNVEMTTDPKGHYIINGVHREAELQVGDQVIKIKRGR